MSTLIAGAHRIIYLFEPVQMRFLFPMVSDNSYEFRCYWYFQFYSLFYFRRLCGEPTSPNSA